MKGRTLAWAICAIALSLTGMSFNAQAEDRQLGYALILSGNSDYMFRGVSYSDQKPILTAYGEASYGIAYVGLFTSMIDYGPIGPWEQDVYLGIRPVTGPINWDVSGNWYVYGNRDEGEFGSVFDTDYFEFKIGAISAITTNLTLGGSVWLTPDQGYAATENISVEGTLAYNLPKVGIFFPTASGLLGYSDSGTNEYYPTGYWLGHQSYTYWNAGVKLAVDKFFMDFRYWDTTIDDDLADARFLFSAGVNLLP